jgi:hypothetical protein
MPMVFITADKSPEGDPFADAAAGRHEGGGLIGKRGVPVGGRGRAGIDPDLVELNVEFLGDQGRLNRVGALALVGARGDQGHAIRVNADVGGESCFAGRQDRPAADWRAAC